MGALCSDVCVFIWGSLYELSLNPVLHQRKDGYTLSLLSIENIGGREVMEEKAGLQVPG